MVKSWGTIIKVMDSCAICGEYEIVLDMIAGGTLRVDDMISAIVL